MQTVPQSSIVQMEQLRKQCIDFSKMDRIGNMLSETTNLLHGLTADPVSVADLEYSADSLNMIRANTQRHDGTQAPLSLDDLRHVYNELRQCCYGMSEAVEISIRHLVLNNRFERVQQSQPIESPDERMVDVPEDGLIIETAIGTPMEESIDNPIPDQSDKCESEGGPKTRSTNPTSSNALPKTEVVDEIIAKDLSTTVVVKREVDEMATHAAPINKESENPVEHSDKGGNLDGSKDPPAFHVSPKTECEEDFVNEDELSMLDVSDVESELPETANDNSMEDSIDNAVDQSDRGPQIGEAKTPSTNPTSILPKIEVEDEIIAKGTSSLVSVKKEDDQLTVHSAPNDSMEKPSENPIEQSDKDGIVDGSKDPSNTSGFHVSPKKEFEDDLVTEDELSMMDVSDCESEESANENSMENSIDNSVDNSDRDATLGEAKNAEVEREDDEIDHREPETEPSVGESIDNSIQDVRSDTHKAGKLSNAGGEKFKCDKCYRRFARKESLQKYQLEHTDHCKFTCEERGSTFSRARGLQIHKRIHTGEKPFKCSECNLAFISKPVLRNHEIKHFADRKLKCDKCDSTFTTHRSLQIHQRIHTGEKPFKCDDCGARFTVKNNLKSHMRKHTGERPYTCDVCSATFKQRYSMVNHRKKLHPNAEKLISKATH